MCMTAIDQALIKAFSCQATPSEARPTPEAPVDPPAEAVAEPQSRRNESAVVRPETESDSVVASSALPGDHVFQPSFRVDSFAWPSGCTRLSMVAGNQMDQLADALLAGLERGEQVVAMSGCRRGDGCTTLLLCASRRLADRGFKIALVDADFDNPLLARRLGLLPEAGWEEVLAARLRAEEVIIESVQDRLAVLPLCGSLPSQGGVSQRPPDSGNLKVLDVLREHYDLVLVDLGEFDGGVEDNESSLAVIGWLDAVVLVRNLRNAQENKLRETRRRVLAAGLLEAGIVENFVDVRRAA